MRLKQLVIKGFKSFPDRTSLVFPLQGISAIVGPNGCGKSNILDAIRWVLGEQSPRMLRAKNMEDVIYSGPNGRQVGYAEVQMVLEYPSDQSKKRVEVARRLYKSGEAKYLIDGKSARLKDILYLFMDTGTGTRAYALVDQGQVARFVEMGPSDRKALIEEAAGISKYKQKRRESESRLQKTIENMERLQDILNEIRREHSRTDREAQTAREYMGLEEALERHKKALLAKLYCELIQDKKNLLGEKETLSKGLIAIQGELKAKREALRVIEQELESNEERYEDLSAEESAIFTECERLEQEIAKKRQWTQDLRQQYREKIIRKKDLEARLHGLAKKKASLDKDLKGIIETIDVLKGEYEREKALYEERFTIKSRLERSVNAIKDEIIDIKSNLARVEGEEKSIVSRRDDYLRRREAIEEKLSRLGEREKEQLERLNAEKALIQRLQQEISGQKEEVEGLKGRLFTLKDEEKMKRNIVEELSSKLDSTTHRLEAIQEIIDKGLDLSDETRNALKLLERKGISHQGLLVDKLHIGSGWESAIEHMIGRDFLQAIIIGSHDDLDRALEALSKEGAGGPIWFLLCEGDDNSAIEERSGGIRAFSSLPIKSSSGILSHIWRRIGAFFPGCKKVQDIEAAIGADLAIFFGVKAKKGEVGLIQRRNEFKALLKRQEDLIKQHKEAKRTLDQTLSSISSLKIRLNEAIQRLDAQKETLIRAKERLSKAEHELAAIEEQKKALDLESKSILLDLEDIEKEGQCLRARKESLLQRLNQLEARLSGELGSLRMEEEHIKAFQEKVTRLKNEIVREETKRDGVKKEIRSIEGAITRLMSELEGSNQLEARLGKSLEESQARLNHIQGELQAAKRRMDEVREEKERLYDLLKWKRDEHTGLALEMEELDGRERTTVERLHKKELALSSIEQRINALKEEAMEGFSEDLEAACGDWASLSQMAPSELKKKIKDIRRAMDGLGPVNLGALKKLEELEERLTFLNAQMEDLKGSYDDLKKAISKIDTRCRRMLKETLEGINQELSRVFPLLFGGGSARLEFSQDGEDILDKGIEFLVRLPGKAVKSLQLLSGGEKALSALSLIFSIFFLKPAPFCVLDEVDAALDEANCVRFSRLLKEISKKCQVILITHNPRIMEAADRLFGVTMEERGVSKLVSVSLQ